MGECKNLIQKDQEPNNEKEFESLISELMKVLKYEKNRIIKIKEKTRKNVIWSQARIQRRFVSESSGN
jgi:hypothetical protein